MSGRRTGATRTHRYGIAAALAAGVALMIPVSGPALGYATFAKWKNLPVAIYINPANADVSGSAAEAAIQVAMNAWNTQAGTPFRFAYGGRVSDTKTGYDAKNVVLFRNATNGGAIATTYWWTMSGAVVDADIIFWDAGSTFFTGTSGCLTGGVYIEDAATHELGHALGLNHSGVSDATMNASYSRCSQTLRTLASDDIAGIRSLYGTSSTSSTTTTTTNTAPTVNISSPGTGTSYAYGASIVFSGSASDREDGTLTSRMIWRSSVDGKIGTGGAFSRTLSAGSHVITASVLDSGGLSASRQVTVTVAAATSTSTTTATSTSFTTGTLTVSGEIVRGIRKAKLRWQGLTSASVDLYRNGVRVALTANDGVHVDKPTTGGSHTYKVCVAGKTICSNSATVTF
jgi:hypothetical protein